MRFKGGIRRKIIFFISMAILSVAIIGLVLGYFSTLNLLKNTIGSDYEKIADALANNVKQRLSEEASYLEGLVGDREYKDALKKSNARYQKMSPADIRKFMADMDRQWLEADKDSPLVKEYLETDISLKLNDKCKADKEMVEVFLSDRYGGTIAASGKTSDFYQADESWWQNAFAKGKGEIFTGDIEFDESSDTLGIAFAFPIRDDNGEVLGVAKTIIDIGLLFDFLKNFKLGNTGYVVLVNEKGYVISHEGVKPLSIKLFSDDNFQKLLHSKTRSMIVNRHTINQKRVFASFAEIKYPLFLKKGIAWRVIVEQDTKEAFWPLYRLMFQASGLAAFLIFLIPILGFIFGSRLARPIEKLKEVSDHVARGELDYSIEVKTGDELEELANSFGAMSSSIKEREGQLVSQKVYSQSIVASMADGLIVVNPDATLRSVNKAILDLLGYKEDELIGQPIKKIFLQEEEEEEEEEEERILNKYFQKIINDGAARNIGLTFIAKGGKEIPVNFSGAIMQQDNKIIGIVGVIRDMRQIMAIISDLEKRDRELEERGKNSIQMQRAMLHIMDDLQEALRAREQFTGMISHELRTPLAAIKEGISVVLDKVTGDINNEQFRYLDIAKNNVDRLNRLISAVLDFQKIDSGKMEFNMEETDMNEVVKAVQNAMMPLFVKKGLAFELELCDNLPMVRFDKDKITQVLTNLVNNALKFTEKGGIAVRTSRGDNFVQVIVKDTGIGIKEEGLQKLFQEFTQLERKVGGTGLGLAICKKIIESHKGKIWAESPPANGTAAKQAGEEKEFGRGAAFYFILPIKERRR